MQYICYFTEYNNSFHLCLVVPVGPLHNAITRQNILLLPDIKQLAVRTGRTQGTVNY